MGIAFIIIIVVIVILVAISFSMGQIAVDPVWNPHMTIGDQNAPNHYVMYTDLMCPYCDVFSRAAMEHWDEFQQYLADNKIVFEIRLTDYLYEGNNSQYSRDSAEAAYCAAREDKFWDFYHGALTALWQDYHSKGIGNNKEATPIKNLPADYWRKIGKKAGLGQEFENCLDNHESLAEVDENTERAFGVAQGMPYFKFNKFTQAGFDDKWGWDEVKYYLDAGLGKH